MNTHETWFTRATGNDSYNNAAARAGLAQATLNRRVTSGKLTPLDVIAVSRAYGHNPIEELARIGFIEKSEIRSLVNGPVLSLASDQEIADEVWRRLSSGGASGVFDQPLGERDDNEAPMRHLRSVSEPEPMVVDESKLRAAKRSGDGRKQQHEGHVEEP